MSLLQRIKSDQLTSRKAKDKFKSSLLTTLLSECAQPGLNDGRRESTDAEVIAVVKKFIKNMKLSLDVKYTEAIHSEMCIVNEYLPVQLSKDDMVDIVEGYLKANPLAKMGEIMRRFKIGHDGQYDGGMLSSVVRALVK